MLLGKTGNEVKARSDKINCPVPCAARSSVTKSSGDAIGPCLRLIQLDMKRSTVMRESLSNDFSLFNAYYIICVFLVAVSKGYWMFCCNWFVHFFVYMLCFLILDASKQWKALHLLYSIKPFKTILFKQKTLNYPNPLLLSVASNPTCNTEILCSLPQQMPHISPPYSLHPSTKTPQLTTLHPCLQEILQGFRPSAQHFRTDAFQGISQQ